MMRPLLALVVALFAAPALADYSGPGYSVPFKSANGSSASSDVARAGYTLNLAADFGGVGDGQTYQQASLTLSGGTTLTVSGAPFNCATDVGKLIGIDTLASWGATYSQWTGTITACASASSVTVSSALPSATLTVVSINFGTNNATAIANAIASCKSVDFGGPEQVYFVSALPTLACSDVVYSGRRATISAISQATWYSGSLPFVVCGSCNKVRFTGLDFIDTYVSNVNSSGISAQDFEFDHNRVYRSTNGVVNYASPYNWSAGLVSLYGSQKRARIHHNYFADVEVGVYWQSAILSTIEFNEFVDTGYAPTYNQTVSGGGAGSVVRMLSGVHVVCGWGNSVHGNKTIGGITGIVFLSANDQCASPVAGNVVSDNTVFGFREEGITFDSSDSSQSTAAFLVNDVLSSVATTSFTIPDALANGISGVNTAYAMFTTNKQLKGQIFQITAQSGGTYTVANFPSNIASLVTPGTDRVEIFQAMAHNVVANNTVAREDTDVNTYSAGNSGINFWLDAVDNVVRNNTLMNTGITFTEGVYAQAVVMPSGTNTLGPNWNNLVDGNTIYRGNLNFGCYTNGRSCGNGDMYGHGNAVTNNHVDGTLSIAYQESLTLKGNRYTTLALQNIGDQYAGEAQFVDGPDDQGTWTHRGQRSMAVNGSVVLRSFVPRSSEYMRSYKVTATVFDKDSTGVASERVSAIFVASRFNAATSTFQINSPSTNVDAAAQTSNSGYLALASLTLSATNTGPTTSGDATGTVTISLANTATGSFSGNLTVNYSIEEMPTNDLAPAFYNIEQ